jgi:hypothetical protein
MNVRHAAAIALVGWYLMAPPIRPGWHFDRDWRLTDRPWVHSNLPLSRWDVLKSYETAMECEAAKSKICDDWLSIRATDQILGYDGPGCQAAEPDRSDLVEVIRNEYLMCIATNDPRLKGK